MKSRAMSVALASALVVGMWSRGRSEEAAPAAASADWPCWRGPKADGLPAVTGIRKDWAGGLKKLWEATDLCKGKNSSAWSSPAIKGDRLVITGRENDNDLVVCLNALTGELVWKKDYAAGGAPVQYGNGPRATASIDGELVYTFGCMGHVGCWKLADGEKVWMQEVDKLGGQRPFWGHASSPLVWKETVIVQGGGKILVVAFEKKTGKVAWTSGTGKAGYAAPMIATVEKKPQLIVFTAAGLLALDPDDGKKLWSYGHVTPFDMNCATPEMVGEDRLLVTSFTEHATGQAPGGAALLALKAAGPEVVWKSRDLNAGHNDPVVVGDCLYCFGGYSLNDRDMRCIDMATGKLKWTTAAVGGPGNVVLVDGLLLCLGNRGKMALAKPSAEKLDVVTEFQAIKGAPVWTAPVLVGDRMYVRFCNQLICYRIKEEPAAK